MAVTPRQRRLAAASDPGLVRSNNEDAYRIIAERNVFAVADGMGGHQAGEVAASMAVDALSAGSFDPDNPAGSLKEIVETAHRQILQASLSDPALRGMGTTFTVAHVGPDKVTIAHVGDSRAYLIGKEQGTHRLTRDHSVADALVHSGHLEPGAARHHPQRHVLTQALGAQESLDVDLVEAEWSGFDFLLLCTDGLTEVLTESEMTSLIAGIDSAEEGVRRLLAATRDRGAPDNVTVILIGLRSHDSFPGSPG